MFNILKIISSALLICTSLTTFAFANNDKAQTAINTQHYELAFIELYATIDDKEDSKHNKNIALTTIGSLHLNALGTSKNYIKALGYYRAAADGGLDVAQHEVANIYFEGTGIKVNYEKAFKYYNLAAQQGHARSATQIGRMFENGIGKEINLKFAMAGYMLGDLNGDIYAKNLVDKLKPKISVKEFSEAEKSVAAWAKNKRKKQ